MTFSKAPLKATGNLEFRGDNQRPFFTFGTQHGYQHSGYLYTAAERTRQKGSGLWALISALTVLGVLIYVWVTGYNPTETDFSILGVGMLAGYAELAACKIAGRL